MGRTDLIFFVASIATLAFAPALPGNAASPEKFKTFDIKPSDRPFELAPGQTETSKNKKGGRFEMTIPAPDWAKDRQGCVDGLPPKKAVKSCSKAIADGKADALMYKVRGNAYYALKDFDKAKGDYAAAIKLAPDWESPYFNEAVVYFVLKDFDRSLWDLKTVLHLNPKKAKAYELKAKIFYNIQRYKQASLAYADALKYAPDNKDARQWLKKAEQHDKASAAARYHAFNTQADADFKKGHYKQAVAGYSASIADMRKNGETPSNNMILAKYILQRAEAKFALGDFETASKEILDMVLEDSGALLLGPDVVASAAEHKLKGEPNNVALLDTLALVLEFDQKYDEAVAVHDKIVKLARNDFEKAGALKRRANALRDTTQAMRDLDEAIRLIPSGSSYSSRGYKHSELKNYDAAAADFTTALSKVEQSSTDYAVYLRARARAYESAEKYDKAMLDLDALSSISPNDSRIRDAKIVVLAKSGKLSEARSQIAALKKSDPKGFKRLVQSLRKIPALTEYANTWDTGEADVWCRGPKSANGEKSVSACTHLINLGAVNPDGSQDKEAMAEVFAYRGAALAKLNKLKEANDDFDKSVSLLPSKGLYLYFRGKSSARLGKLKEAAQDLKKACELDKKLCK